MKTINAYWEEKNLGKKVVEVIFDEDDNIENYKKLNLTQYDYVLAKIPLNNNLLVHQLESEGFKYLENLITLQKKVSTIKYVPAMYLNIAEEYDHQLISDQKDLLTLTGEIKKGLFTNDRVSQDPFFNECLSSNRYANWINSLFNSENFELYFIIKRKDQSKVGFFILNNSDHKKYKQLLAGLFNDYKKTGIGFLTVLFPLMICKEQNINRLETYVSSNNLDILNMHSAVFAYEFKSTYVVLRKVQEINKSNKAESLTS